MKRQSVIGKNLKIWTLWNKAKEAWNQYLKQMEYKESSPILPQSDYDQDVWSED